jgi:hydroxymethylglutaryl-CoA reductase
MGLHARAVALAAGATGDQAERVAAMIVEARDITLDAARKALASIEAGSEEAIGLGD